MSPRYYLLRLAVLVSLSLPAFADVYTLTYSDANVGGSAVFTISGNTMQVKLTNTKDPTVDIGESLVGVQWGYGGTAPSDLTLVSVVPMGIMDLCDYTKPNNHCDGITEASPYLWEVNSTSGWANSTPNLFAGGGSGKAYGILNLNYDVTHGLKNAEHNPWLVGPVTFNLTFQGDAPVIDEATLFFGTAGDNHPAVLCTDCVQTPEPSSILLLIGMLGGVTMICRKRLQGNC